MATTISGQSWNLEMNQEWIDTTCGIDTLDPKWRGVDSNGHEHHYEHGYPTLDLVIEASHWCDGDEGIYNHDPHEQIDASHYECLICREVVEPGIIPAFTPQQMPGMRSYRITGFRSDGAQVEAWLTEDDVAVIRAGHSEAAVTAFIDALPEDRIYTVTFASR
jgi:hypothetical protein